MDKNIHTRWMEILHPLFPDDASLSSDQINDDFLLSASWNLNGDGQDLPRRSRTVVIEVPQETVAHYIKKSETRQIYDDQKLYKQVKEFLHLFNPNHDTPTGQPPPEVRLVASNAVLDS